MTLVARHEARQRRRRRLRLVYVLASSPVMLALLVAAVLLLRPSVVMQGALDSFAANRFEASERESSTLLENNILEPYLPWFNRGDARAAQEQYTDAIDDFERALALAPDERQCDVRVNLALSWERLGDVYVTGGYFQGALLLYRQAAAVIAAGADCTPPDVAGEQLEAAKERVREKMDEAKRQRDAAEAAKAAEGQPGAESRQQKLEKLRQLGQQGAQEKANGDAEDRGDNGASSGYPDKPW